MKKWLFEGNLFTLYLLLCPIPSVNSFIRHLILRLKVYPRRGHLMSWINPAKTSKKIDNYVKINDETMWLPESDDGMDVKIHKFHCASLRYETFYCTVCSNSPFLSRTRRVASVFSLIPKCYKIVLCVLTPPFLPRSCKIVQCIPYFHRFRRIVQCIPLFTHIL